MKVFVTGATGFIGAHVVRQLALDGHELLLLARRRVDVSGLHGSHGPPKTVIGDLADLSAMADEVRRFRPETALHLAWEGIPCYDAKTSLRNLQYGLRLFSFLIEAGCRRIVSSGSCWEYAEKVGRMSEDDPVAASNPFTASKIALHWMGKELAKENDTDFIWVRLFYVFGPGQKRSSLVPHLIERIRDGRLPDIKTPSARNDFVYVGDVATALSSLVERPITDTVLNVGSGCSVSVLSMMKELYGIVETECPDEIRSRKALSSSVDFWADISRMERNAGWRPETSMEEALRKTYDFFTNP